MRRAALLFVCLLWGCFSVHFKVWRTNLNPPPVHWQGKGAFLLLVDVEVVAEKVSESVTEQRFVARYFANRLGEFLATDEIRQLRQRWEEAPLEEKTRWWRRLFRRLEDFLAQEVENLNPQLRYVKVKRILLAFRPYPVTPSRGVSRPEKRREGSGERKVPPPPPR